MMNIGFIGIGNMGGAIVKGLCQNENKIVDNIWVYDKNESKIKEYTEKYKVTAATSIENIISTCEVILVAVKPNVLKEVLGDREEELKGKNNLIISIAAGYSISDLEEIIGVKEWDSTPIVRVMPNINAEVLESISGMCCNAFVKEEQKQIVKQTFSAIGKVVEVDEKLFSTFSVIAGCSPAFTYMFIDSLAKAAHKSGMNKKEAIYIAAQAVLGSAKMILESGTHPYELADKVCSPGGTTIEGVCVLEENKFQSTVVKAVDAAIYKDNHLM